jgi:Mce-associated membrane protein
VDADRPDARALSARRGSLYLFPALLLVPLLLAAGLWVWAEQRYDDARAVADTDRAVLDAARKGVLTWGAVDHRRVDEYVEAVKETATGDFLEQFEQSEQPLRELVEENRSVQVPTVPKNGIGLLERIDGTARVLVAMDATVTNKATEQPQPRQYRLQLTLLEEDGTWRVSGLEFVDACA